MTEQQARSLRTVLVQGVDSLDDKTISTAPDACRRMRYTGGAYPQWYTHQLGRQNKTGRS